MSTRNINLIGRQNPGKLTLVFKVNEERWSYDIEVLPGQTVYVIPAETTQYKRPDPNAALNAVAMASNFSEKIVDAAGTNAPSYFVAYTKLQNEKKNALKMNDLMGIPEIKSTLDTYKVDGVWNKANLGTVADVSFIGTVGDRDMDTVIAIATTYWLNAGILLAPEIVALSFFDIVRGFNKTQVVSFKVKGKSIDIPYPLLLPKWILEGQKRGISRQAISLLNAVNMRQNTFKNSVAGCWMNAHKMSQSEYPTKESFGSVVGGTPQEIIDALWAKMPTWSEYTAIMMYPGFEFNIRYKEDVPPPSSTASGQGAQALVRQKELLTGKSEGLIALYLHAFGTHIKNTILRKVDNQGNAKNLIQKITKSLWGLGFQSAEMTNVTEIFKRLKPLKDMNKGGQAVGKQISDMVIDGLGITTQ